MTATALLERRTDGVAGSRDNTFTADFPPLYDLAYRVAYRVLGNREDASDVASEALARAYVRWGRLDDPAPWVATVAGRAAIDVVRRRKTARDKLPALAPGAPPPDATPDRLDLQRALLALPTRQREVVVLRYLADRSEAETAAVLGLSHGTVKSHASRGLAALRSTLGRPS
jgi:RNA polymerase sigma-70 factor (sigma-E family)